MSWIEKLPSGRYRARYRDGAGVFHSQTFARRGEARTFLDTVGADMHRGEWIDPRGGATLFSVWAEDWLAARVVRLTTRNADDGRFRGHLIPEFGALPLKDISPLRIRSWVTRLSDRLAPATVRHCHALLSTCLADAVAEGLLASNPCRGTRLPKAMAALPHFLAPEELQRLFVAVEQHYRPLVVVAAATGMRWGELVGLRPTDVDLAHTKLQVVQTLIEVNGVLSVSWPKTPKSIRTISLPRQAVDQIEVALSAAREYVFVTPEGYPMRRHNFSRRVWKPALAEAGLNPAVRFHDLRHTHVALLIAAGVPIKAIQERLGHTSIVTTMDRYGHLLTSVDDQVIEGLENQLPAAAPRT